MKIRQLKYFIATAEAGQVSKAAVSLSISQSSITTAIRELEIDIGTKLFTRTVNGMELTENGREFMNAAYEILAKVEEARNLPKLNHNLRGSLTIATTYTVMGYFLPYHLDRIQKIHPNLKIKVHELSRESVEEGLISKRFDMAVLLTSNTFNVELETETLFRSARRVWVAGGHPLSHKRKVSMEDVSAEDYILLTVDEAANTTMKYWHSQQFQPRIKLRTSSVEAVRSMVANGQGVTILSDMVYRPWSLEGKRISTVQTDIEIPSMDVGLAWYKGSELNSASKVLYDYFKESFLAPKF